MAITAKPDDLNKLLNASKRHYSRMHAKMRRNKDVYNQKLRVYSELPEGVEPFKSSRGTGVVDDLAEQINLTNPDVTAREFGTSLNAKNKASLQRRWGEAQLEAIQVQVGQVAQDMVMMGAGTMKWLLNPVVAMPVLRRFDETADDHDLRMNVHTQQIQHEPTFIVQALDPISVYPSVSRGRLQYVIEEQERRAMDMWENYPGWTDPKAKKLSKVQQDNPLRKVNWLEYWSWVYTGEQWEGWYIVEADRERIIEVRNPYMQVPYAFEYSGLGRRDAEGDPFYEAKSILDKLEGDLEAEVRIKTAADVQWQFHVLPRLVVEGVNASDAAKMFNVKPGGVVERPPGGAFEWLDTPPPSKPMLDFLGMVQSDIDRRVNPALSGQRTADFGIQQALQLGQAMKSVSSIQGAVNTVAEKFLNGTASIMSSYDLGMDLYGTNQRAEKSRKIKGSDFKQYNFDVVYEATDPTEDQRKMLALLSVADRPGKLSNETFAKHVLADMIEDWEEEEARIFAEQVLEQMIQTGQLMQLVMQRSAALSSGTEMEQTIRDQTAAVTGQIQSAASGAAPNVPDRAAAIEQTTGAGSIAAADNVGQETLSQQA